LKVKHIAISNFRGIRSLSWQVKGDFNCIIGAGDTCKTTILTALDYALSPRTALALDDADFYEQDVSEDICIQITLSDWDERQPAIREFFRENKFAQYKCGLGDTGPLPEPEGGTTAISVSLRVDKSLEPKWSIVKGPDEASTQERAPLYASDRAVLGLSRLDVYSDAQFSWARNTILTRLSSAADNSANLNTVLSALAREMRQTNVSAHPSIAACQSVANTIKREAQDTGVKLSSLSPKLDIQRQSMTTGAISLHENNVPLRNKGNGSKRLIAAAMQMQFHDGKSIALVDEIEMGLEPHRIRGVILRLKKTRQQLFTTTHSPVVIRELSVSDNELYVCRRDETGLVKVESIGTVPDIQGAVRSNAEAFLGSKIVACEGVTEIGCLRAYDIFRLDADNPPVWSLATAYFNCGGGSKIKVACSQLAQLGFQIAVLCDNDAQDQLNDEDVQSLVASGTHVCQWDKGNSTERQLFTDLPWRCVPEMLTVIGDAHDTLTHSTIVDRIRKDSRAIALALTADSNQWSESPLLRQVIGDLAHEDRWIKRTDYAGRAFHFALPHLPDACTIKTKLAALWAWVQKNV
jgi:putative ATP-dependent endonuclease of the OLD family